MFCVVYQWAVIPSKEKVFRETWCEITEAIFRQHGSLGSRLHKNYDGSFVAYAQWPSREQWQNQAITIGVKHAESKQRKCLLQPIRVILQLDMTDDMLKTAPFAEIEDKPKLKSAKLRVARPTEKMEEVIRFYHEGLGLEILGDFKDHAGFDGTMLGTPDSSYHLEFTTHKADKSNEVPKATPSPDDLLVFYLPDPDGWESAVKQMNNCGYKSVASFNPYWDKYGKTYEDPDGYRVVLQNSESL
jgi:Glyoxalase/Bleomycin resistance protein/Dioxygenase superfamily